MNISFSSLVGQSTLSFNSTDPLSVVLRALATATMSQNANDLSAATGLSKRDVGVALATLMTKGVAYEEQDEHYNLSRYGRGLVSHMQGAPQAEAYNYEVPTQQAYGKILSVLAETPLSGAAMFAVVKTGPAKAALQDLVARGFVAQTSALIDNGVPSADPTNVRYALTPLGEAHITQANEQREFAKNVSPALTKDNIPAAQMAYMNKMYEYFKQQHPEYNYVYSKMIDKSEDNKLSFFNDVRKWLRGGKNEPPWFNSTAAIKKYWGVNAGGMVPAQTSLEAAFMHEIRFVAMNVPHATTNTPNMQDIVLGRNYMTILAQKATPARVKTVLKSFPPGTVLSEEQVVEVGAKIVGQPMPSTLISAGATELIRQTLTSRRDLQNGVFFPGDRKEDVAAELVRRLKAGDSKTLAVYTETMGRNSGAKNALPMVFARGADYSGVSFNNFSSFSDIGDLIGVGFSSADLSGANFNSLTIKECDFSNAKLVGANFSGTTFSHNNVQGADFANAGGLGDDGTTFDFQTCTGTPVNFPKIRRSEINRGELQRVYDVRAQPDAEQLSVSPAWHSKATALATPLLKELYGLLHTKIGGRRVQLLRFADDPSVTDEQKANDIRSLLAGGERAAWMTSPQDLIAYMKSGAGQPYGITQQEVNKAIGRVAPKAPRAPRPAEVVDDASTVLTAVRTALSTTPIARQSLIDAFGSQYPEYTEYLQKLPEQLDTRDIQRFTAFVARFTNYHDASPRVHEAREKMKLPSYVGRLSNTDLWDRGRSSTTYKDKMIGVLIQPTTVGVTDPDVRKIFEDINKEKQVAPTQHWQRAIASARIEPHTVTEIDPTNRGTGKRNVWVIVELQADPLQKFTYGYAHVVDPELPSSYNDGLYRALPLNSPQDKLLADIAVRGSIPASEVLTQAGIPQAIEKLKALRLLQISGGVWTITPLGTRVAKAYSAMRKFRSMFKNWPSALILEAINRAIQLGGVDEIWVVSAKDFSEQQDWDLAAVYDRHAEQFTNTVIQPGLDIEGSSSTLYNSGRKPKDYYVINIAEWKNTPGLSMASSLTTIAGRYADKAARYVERAKESHAYIATVLPPSALYSSAIAFWMRKESVTPAALPAIIADIEATTGVQVGQPITNWVHLLVNGTNAVKKRLLRKVRRDPGSAPNRLAHESLDFFLEKHPEVDTEEKQQVHQYFDVLWAAHGQELFGEEIAAHDNYVPGVTPTEGGDVPVGPAGEDMPPEGDLSDVDRLIQQQNQERQKQDQQEAEQPGIQFSPPGEREQRTMVQAEIDRLLDRLHMTQDEGEKAKIRRQLHEMSTLASLRFAALTANAVVVHEDGKWVVKTHDRSRTLGTHDTEAEAQAQLRAIEISKHATLTFASALSIQPVTAEDHQRVLALRSNVFAVVSSNAPPDSYYASIVDWSLCRKVTTGDGHIVGAYLIGRRQLPDVLAGMPGMRVYDDLDKYAGLRGVEGVSVFIEQPFRGRVGAQLLATPYSIPDVDYVWGFAHKALGNIEQWKHRRRVVAENDQLYVTAADVPHGLVFSAVDQEFGRPKGYPEDPERNDWWAFEPAHGESAPVGGGPEGSGAADDTSNSDMKGGFYTDLNLPDMARKRKELVTFEPSDHVNLQPSFIASVDTTGFDFVRFKTAVMGGMRGLNEFKDLTDEQLTTKLQAEWQWARQAGIV